MRIQLVGDQEKATAWIGWAKKALVALRGVSAYSTLQSCRKTYKINSDITIEVMWSPHNKRITIWAAEAGGSLILCHAGSDTGINGYARKAYQLNGTKLSELTIPQAGIAFSSGGIDFTDDGKYYLEWGGTTYDDPDDYSYHFNTGGLVAETESGTGIKVVAGNTCRFILNQSHEEEFFMPYITEVDGTDRSYLVLSDSLTFRPYRIKGNPMFSRYTDDSIIYLHSRTKEGPGAVLLIETYNDGPAEGFGDNLFTINKLYKKNLALNSEGQQVKTVKAINDGTNGAAVYGSTKFYLDRQVDQRIGRVKTFFGGTNFAEPAVTEDYGLGTTEETFYRAADHTTNTYFMKGSVVYGSDKDPGGHILMPPNFPNIANDVKLPVGYSEDEIDYVRMEKNSAYTTLNTGLYINGQLIEESGPQDILVLADGTGGTQDTASGRWIAENNGPIVIKQTNYNIMHTYHDENFHAALYKKTVYTADSVELLPYRQLNILGSQLDPVMGQIKKYLVESISTYHIVVNGVITQLKDSDDIPYSYNSKEYTLTSGTTADPDTGHPQLYIIQDLPWVDVAGTGNMQITRIFSNATKNSLLFSFDVWDTKSEHDLIYDDSNPSYKYLWADYDTAVTPFPPLVDLEDIEGREWLMFDSDGEAESIETPTTDGKDYERINGILMVNI